MIPGCLVASMLGGGAGGVDAADFDGTNDYATRGAGLTNAADSKLFTFVMWTKADAVGGRYFTGVTTLGGSTLRFSVHEQSGVFFLQASSPGGTNILNINTTTAPSTTAWQCLMCSVDLADTAKRHLYLGDTNELNVNTYTDAAIDFTLADWAVGARPDGSGKHDGGLAEMYFWTDAYIDLSVLANRRLFISNLGQPAGPGGAVSALGIPDVRFHLNDGETANNFVANVGNGDGGAFTVTGALSTYASSPSD